MLMPEGGHIDGSCRPIHDHALPVFSIYCLQMIACVHCLSREWQQPRVRDFAGALGAVQIVISAC
jgi:hypothetical protein